MNSQNPLIPKVKLDFIGFQEKYKGRSNDAINSTEECK
jgi:hypothetical protein